MTLGRSKVKSNEHCTSIIANELTVVCFSLATNYVQNIVSCFDAVFEYCVVILRTVNISDSRYCVVGVTIASVCCSLHYISCLLQISTNALSTMANVLSCALIRMDRLNACVTLAFSWAVVTTVSVSE